MKIPLNIVLNKEQEQAVMHDGSPLLVPAGPGSGKTTVIVERIKQLIKNGMSPSEILCLTFTDKAANVMKERLEDFYDVTEMQISTYHSFCHDVLQENVLDSGIGMSSGVITKASRLVWAVENYDAFNFKHVQHGNNPVEVISSMVEGISNFKDEFVSPETLRKFLNDELGKPAQLVADVEREAFLHRLDDLHKLYVKYQDYLRAEQLIDYDDMLVETVNLFKNKPHILKKYQKRFKYVLIDEFQDNNFVQLELVKLLTTNGNITAVGDDDQSIMKFQGAYAKIFQDFQTHFGNTKLITLVENLRSPKPIVNFALKLLEGKPDRIPKNLYSNIDGPKVQVIGCTNDVVEVDFVIKKIEEIFQSDDYSKRLGRPVSFGDFTILSRNRNTGRKFAQGLNAHSIPAAFVGDANLFSTSIGRDAMAFLQVASNPTKSGLAITRLLQNSGISEQDIARINEAARIKAYNDENHTSDYVFEFISTLNVSGLVQTEQIKDVVEMINRCIKLREESVSKAVFDILMRESGLYKSTIRTDNLENKKKQLILKKIIEIAQQFELQKREGTLDDFLKYVHSLGKYDVELEEGTELSNAVVVSTIHQSKGKEFPFVFVVDVAARGLPGKFQDKEFFVPDELANGLKNNKDPREMHIEEERRVFYVALTRAKTELFVTYPISFSTGRTRGLSKFLTEDLDFQNNDDCKTSNYNSTSTSIQITQREITDVLAEETQASIIKLVDQFQIKNAISKLLELAKIKHFKDNGTISGLNIDDMLDVKPDDNIDKKLVVGKIQLVNKDELHLSASAFDNYIKCPLMFKYNRVLKVPFQSSPVMNLGSMVHKVFELISKRIHDQEEVNLQIAFDILEKTWNSRPYTSKQKEQEDKEKAKVLITKFLEWITTNPNKIKGVEKEFTITLDDVAVTGKIDLVMETPSGEFEVYDFKTGTSIKTKNEALEDPQMNLYPLAVKELYGKLPTKTTLFYIAMDKFVEIQIDPTHVNEQKVGFENIIKLILDEKFPAEHKRGQCHGCSYLPICDSAET